MNVYKRLQTCRVELKKLPIKESGENKFAGYKYMELGDFLPHIVDLCHAHGLCTVVSFDDKATLTVINSDKPEEREVFTSPMSTAELKGCHAIQNLGAVETYLRRYLYVTAFDIVEHDALDSTHGKEVKQAPKTINADQNKRLRTMLTSNKIDPAAFKSHFGIESSLDLLASKMEEALKWINDTAKGAGDGDQV